MTISSSLNAGVSGLSANATRLGTISDNIANASTMGYRRVETDFYSVVMGSGGGTYTAGGVRTSTQRLISEGGSVVGSNNATDLAVRGGGFFPVARAAEVTGGAANPQMFLTSTGSFRPDAQGYLRTESGLMLMGWPADANGNVPAFPRDTAAGLEPVQMAVNQLTAEPSTWIDLGVNLPSTEAQLTSAPSGPIPLTLEYYDAMGGSQSLTMTFTSAAPGMANTWNAVVTDPDGTTIGDYTMTFSNAPGSGGELINVVANGPGTVTLPGGLNVTVDDPVLGAGGPGDQNLTINIGAGPGSIGISQLGDTFAPLSIQRDGSQMGTMTNVEVDANGFVTAFFDNGTNRVIYQVPLADLPNPNGMRALDRQTYLPTPESGGFVLWNAGTGPTGEIVPFAREESATDVAGELTDMIQTQRAYSSNAKVIQTVDEMLQETTNMKR
ncbi:flagellar hook protein FlgE [Citreimonas sp.]|uniref:flagellar hook protein FlgE n=1 Tax=Citreimonas sp. TaxID=3036715 RepID=UPI0035C7DC29